ncbi:MFS transporter [Nakamurella sp. YIM 132087]|uniref:MFS transporter n=1 Tax=Nakamurella alba TaxID=2665158 RepID=A0A7K1FPL1_9ACTN|nr:MFS transporter [Nakamurella alba]MTD16020.1 MFS transporter [Nakamurella alba]
MPRALIPLAVGAFAIGCTEFVIMGLLPQIGADLGASIPAMGILITAYAIGVMVGAPAMTALSTWLTTKQTLITLMAVFAAGNLLAALAPNYQVMLVARVVASLAHGSFFGVGAIAARRAVPAHKATQAISLMFTGLTLANVIGVPLGTFVGQQFDWRWVFGGIAVLGLVTILTLRVYLPEEGIRIELRTELGAFRKSQVWIGLGVTTISFGSLFAVYSYITPILTEHTGLGGTAITVVLAVFGIGTTIGTVVGGRLGDRYGMRMVAVGLLITAVLLATFTFTSYSLWSAVATLVAFGAVMFALGPAVQNKIIIAAGSGGSLVSAANQGAFNVANALGAALGAYVINVGWGYGATMWVGAGLAALGAVMVTVNGLVDRSRTSKALRELVAA